MQKLNGLPRNLFTFAFDTMPNDSIRNLVVKKNAKQEKSKQNKKCKQTRRRSPGKEVYVSAAIGKKVINKNKPNVGVR